MANPPKTDFENAAASIPDYLIRHASLRQLQLFEAIVRHGSFTRAAEELFLTQPTVSMQTKKLAEAIGLPLFEQVGRNVKPTEIGMIVYETCREIFGSLSMLEMRIDELKGIKRGRLRLGVITTAQYFTPEVIGAFCKRFPGIDAVLKVSNRERIIERINANEDDLYIMGAAPADRSDVESSPFAPNPLVVMARRDHPLVGQKNVPLERIVEEPFIMREPGSGTRDLIMKIFQERGLTPPKVRMELGSNEAIKHAIVGGLGLSIMSLHTIALEGNGGPVAIIDVEGFPIERQWFLVYTKNKELSPVARTFLEYALGIGPDMRDRLVRMWPDLHFECRSQQMMATGKVG